MKTTIKKWILALVLGSLALTASAVQETFTDAGVLDCSAITVCKQSTSDQLFQLRFKPVYPWSTPDVNGFEVRQNTVEIRNANGGLIDLGIMAVSLTGSSSYNGMNFIGAIRMDALNTAGKWVTVSQWSSSVGSPSGIYVVFNGHATNAPLVQGVRAVRLVGVNGTTAFRVGMMNLTAY
ncbi:hypothetical protein [Ideonella sp.]|uniref:hypothetical protein n=1 Tax=Ideonella sp. TaxID=1929293 RepID=UPI003BB6BBB3